MARLAAKGDERPLALGKGRRALSCRASRAVACSQECILGTARPQTAVLLVEMNAAGECFRDDTVISDRAPGALPVQVRIRPGPGDDNPLAREVDSAVRLHRHRCAVDAQRESAL